MQTLYTVSQIRDIEAWAIENLSLHRGGSSGGEYLMRLAGNCVANEIQMRWKPRSVAVVVGSGNNGGDGWVAARILADAGVDVTVYESSPREKANGTNDIKGDAALMRDEYLAKDYRALPSEQFSTEVKADAKVDVIIDALFGSGLSRPLEGEAARLVETINNIDATTFAVDVPSGLDADTGSVATVAVRADLTLTFIGAKRGMYTGVARDYCGTIVLNTLDIDCAASPTSKNSDTKLVGASDVVLPERKKTAHKGTGGRVLIVGGNTGFGGAVRMAGEAAARVGAGLVNVALRPGNLAMVEPCPVLMAREIDEMLVLDELLAMCDVIAIGPGLGRDEWAREVFQRTLATRKQKQKQQKTIVIDADALRWLAEQMESGASHVCDDKCVLTPHPGEAAALLGETSKHIEKNRFAAAERIVERYGGVCVLKGAGALVYGGNDFAVCADGGPAMASGGMGDVLTGIIAGLCAQWQVSTDPQWNALSLWQLTYFGVCMHSAAADRAAAGATRGIIATDLFAHLFDK